MLYDATESVAEHSSRLQPSIILHTVQMPQDGLHLNINYANSSIFKKEPCYEPHVAS